MRSKNSRSGPAAPAAPSVRSVDQLIDIWDDEALSVDEKLAATFGGLGRCLESQDVEVRRPAASRRSTPARTARTRRR